MEMAAIGSGWPATAGLMAGLWLFVMGAVFASFLGVVAERGVQHEPISGRSHCACGRQLRWWELIPVLGWTWLGVSNGGKSRCCDTAVPVRYVLSEVGLGVLWGGAIFVVGNWWIWGVLAVVGMSLVLACNAWSAKRELMSSELVDVVDKNDVVIDVATRETTHRVGLLHRIAAVFVFDDQGRLTIQVRKADEGLLDHSVGGHVASGESYAEAAAREAREGLGVDEVLSFVGVVPVVERRGANHLVALFWCNAKEGWSFVPNDEVGEVLYQEVDEVVEEMSREPERFAPGFVATLGLWLAR